MHSTYKQGIINRVRRYSVRRSSPDIRCQLHSLQGEAAVSLSFWRQAKWRTFMKRTFRYLMATLNMLIISTIISGCQSTNISKMHTDFSECPRCDQPLSKLQPGVVKLSAMMCGECGKKVRMPPNSINTSTSSSSIQNQQTVCLTCKSIIVCCSDCQAKFDAGE